MAAPTPCSFGCRKLFGESMAKFMPPVVDPTSDRRKGLVKFSAPTSESDAARAAKGNADVLAIPQRFISTASIFTTNGKPPEDPEADVLEMLEACFDRMDRGKAEDVADDLAPDAVWHLLHLYTVEGRDAIVAHVNKQRKRGRRIRAAGPWKVKEPGTYTREVKVCFPSKATHECVQTVTVEDGLITSYRATPKYPALHTALKFAMAGASQDDEGALACMSEGVVWTAWDGFHVQGKDAIRKLFRNQRQCEVRRFGETEFEAAKVNEEGGCFERVLQIERIDGIKVRTKQRLYVRSELGELEPVTTNKTGGQRKVYGIVHRIIEVKVLATEEMVDGKWVLAEDGGN